MSRPVKVKSIDAVEGLAAALARFQEEAAAASRGSLRRWRDSRKRPPRP